MDELIDGSQAKLSNEEILRYSRHLIMPEVTLEGQRAFCAWAPAGSVRRWRCI